MALHPLMGVSDATFEAQEELLFRTAARLKGLVFYRILCLLALPLAAWYYHGTALWPLLFWATFAVLMGFNLLQFYYGYIGSDCTQRPIWLFLIDASAYTLLTGLTGGIDSHFQYFFFPMVLYSAIWFNHRLSLLAGATSMAAMLILYGLAGPRNAHFESELIAHLLALLGLTLGSAGISSLVAGSRERMVKTAMDLIHANKRVLAQQTALQDSEARVRLVLDSASEGIFGMDLAGRCIFANPSCLRMLGYDSDADLIGRDMHSLMHHTRPDGRHYPQSECAIQQATLRGDSAHRVDELHWRRDGGGFPVEYWSHPIRQGGQIVGTVATFIDITQRKQAESRLREVSALNETILDSANYSIIATDLDGNITRFSAGAERMLGYRADEMVGKASPVCIQDIEELAARAETLSAELGYAVEPGFGALSAKARQGDKDEGEWTYIRKNGERFPVYLSVSPLRDALDQIIGYMSIAADISDRKAAEAALLKLNSELEDRVRQRTQEISDANTQLRDTLATLRFAQEELLRSEKLASLGSLVAGVAHELNTPLGNSLTVATTLADRLRGFNLEFESGTLRRSSLNDFVAATRQASELLTGNLLKASELITHFKQVAVDQTSDQRRPFDLAEVVGEVVTTLRPQFKATPHIIEVDIPPDIRMDSFPGPLGQILTNLVNNALFHGFDGATAGVVHISASQSGDLARILVADNGRGIPAEHQSRVFDPFFTTRLGQGGSGLGLHIVYSIVTRILGGRIMLSSQSGAGTSFHLELPLIAPERSQDSPWSAVAPSSSKVSP